MLAPFPLFRTFQRQQQWTVMHYKKKSEFTKLESD